MPKDPLSDLDHVQSARIGELIITVHKAQEAHYEETIRLLRQELTNITTAWRELWEQAGCPAGQPDHLIESALLDSAAITKE